MCEGQKTSVESLFPPGDKTQVVRLISNHLTHPAILSDLCMHFLKFNEGGAVKMGWWLKAGLVAKSTAM